MGRFESLVQPTDAALEVLVAGNRRNDEALCVGTSRFGFRSNTQSEGARRNGSSRQRFTGTTRSSASRTRRPRHRTRRSR